MMSDSRLVPLSRAELRQYTRGRPSSQPPSELAFAISKRQRQFATMNRLGHSPRAVNGNTCNALVWTVNLLSELASLDDAMLGDTAWVCGYRDGITDVGRGWVTLREDGWYRSVSEHDKSASLEF